MFEEFVIRFLAGGLLVSIFAILADILRPKRFAGLFGAAPSVALATLVLTIWKSGKAYAAIEAHSMMAGGIAFLLYAVCVMCVLARCKSSALLATLALLPVWFAAAFGLLVFIR